MRATLAALLAFVAHRVARIRRRHVEASVRRAGLPASTARLMFRELATSLVELLWVAFGWLGPADVVHIPDDTVQRIQAARAKGPVMLFCAHTSNWELLAMRAAALFPLALVVKTQGVGIANRFIQRVRARAGLRTILPDGALAQARSSFSRSEVVAMVIDQVPASRAHGDPGSFLGAAAIVDRSPAVLARRVRAHVFVIFASRKSGRVEATLALEVTPDVVHQTAAKELMARATAALDAHVRRHPSSWLWLHRRWRSPIVGPISARAGRHGHHGSAAPKTFLHGEKEVIESTS